VKTQYVKASELGIKLEKIKNSILNDELIVFPTETVYGLGASIYSPTAIGKIFAIKGRPQDNPLIVHIGHEDQLNDLVLEKPPIAKRLMD
jgi:L-threonylcarbamoyladenylate synthase